MHAYIEGKRYTVYSDEKRLSNLQSQKAKAVKISESTLGMEPKPISRVVPETRECITLIVETRSPVRGGVSPTQSKGFPKGILDTNSWSKGE